MPVTLDKSTEQSLIRSGKKINAALALLRKEFDVDKDFRNGTFRLQRKLLSPVRSRIQAETPVDRDGRPNKKSGHRPGDLKRSVVAVRNIRKRTRTGAIVSTVGYRKKKAYGQPGFVPARQIAAIEYGTSRIRPHKIVTSAFERMVRNAAFEREYVDETFELFIELLDKQLKKQGPGADGTRLRASIRELR